MFTLVLIGSILCIYIYNQLVWAEGCAVFFSRAERACLSDRSQVATALWAKPSQRNHQTRRSGPESGQRRTDFWSWNKASSQLEKNTSWGLCIRTYSLHLLECLRHCGHVTSQVVLTSSICGWNHRWSERMKIELLFFRRLIAGSFSFGGEPEFVTICVFRFEERIHDWKLLGSPGRATSSVHALSSCASIFSCFQQDRWSKASRLRQEMGERLRSQLTLVDLQGGKQFHTVVTA